MKRYLNYISETHHRELEQEDFMETLSVPIKNDIYSYLYNRTLNSCKLINKLFPKSVIFLLIKIL